MNHTLDENELRTRVSELRTVLFERDNINEEINPGEYRMCSVKVKKATDTVVAMLVDQGDLDSAVLSDIHASIKKLNNPKSGFSSLADEHGKLLYLSIERTGHQYYGSPYEACDSCGTCNDARCGSCRIKITIEDQLLGLPCDLTPSTVIMTDVLDTLNPEDKATRLLCDKLCLYLSGRRKYYHCLT